MFEKDVDYDRRESDDQNSDSGEPDYGKLGFFSAILNEELDTLLKRLDVDITFSKARLEELYQIRKSSHQEKILRLEGIILAFEEKRKTLVDEINELHDKLVEQYEIIAKGQVHLVEKRIEDARKELLNMLDAISKIHHKRGNEQGKISERFKTSTNVLSELAQRYKETYEEVKDKSKQLMKSGVSYVSIHLLLSVSAIVAVASGSFFSIFAEKSDLGAKQLPFQLLYHVFLSSEEFFKITDNRIEGGMLMFAILAAFLIITSFVIYFCQFVLTGIGHSKGEFKFGKAIGGKNGRFSTKISSRTFLAFWLNLLPFFFLLGAFFILVCVGSNPGDLKKLAEGMASNSLGVIISLMSGGLFFLYIIKVIEPRVSFLKENEKPKRFVFIEVSLLMGAFIVFLVLLIVVALLPIDSIGQEKAEVSSTAGFLITVTISGILTGYAIRHLSLLITTEYLELTQVRLAYLSTLLSGDQPLAAWLSENTQFGKHFHKLQKELYQLISGKLKVSNYLYHVWPYPLYITSVINRLSQLVRQRDSQKGYLSPQLNSFERINFPEQRIKIDQLSKQFERLDDDLFKISGERRIVRKSNLRSTGSEMRKYEEKLEKSRGDLYELELELNDKKIQLNKQHYLRESEIKDGFILGMWFVKSGFYDHRMRMV